MRQTGLVLLLAVVAVGSSLVHADGEFHSCLTGAQENPAPGVNTPATGTIEAEFDCGLTEVDVSLTFDDLLGTFTAAHFHCGVAGQNGPVAWGLISPGPCLLMNGNQINCTLTNANFSGGACTPVIGRPVENLASLYTAMVAGQIYANVHSTSFPGGEIRAQMLRVVKDCDDDESDDEDSDGGSSPFDSPNDTGRLGPTFRTFDHN